MNNLEKLVDIFSDALEIEKSKISDELKYGDFTWDSVAHMALIAALEQEFDIMIDSDDVIDMSSLKKAKEILSKYGVIIDT